MLTKANNSPEGRREQGRASNGHFLGFWARLNCENMPVIPAWLVRSNLNDARKIPYLLVWKRESDGKIMETVRLTHFVACGRDSNTYAEIKRPDGSMTTLRIIWRMLPRNSGRALLLLCPHCNIPRRFVYGWQRDSFSGRSNRVRQVSWCCRSCNLLRYSSEGGYLRPNLRGLGQLGVMLRSLGNLPRPEPWLPRVFTSPQEAAEAGLCALK